MTRENKFQAWNRKDKTMHLDVLVGNNIVIYSIEPETREYDWDYLDCGDVAIRQYTGLKDKNGVEIYENDVIFNSLDDENVVVELVDGGFYGHWVENGFYTPLRQFIRNNEVVGNIYENPELLELKP